MVMEIEAFCVDCAKPFIVPRQVYDLVGQDDAAWHCGCDGANHGDPYVTTQDKTLVNWGTAWVSL
jgi:hypothetical protein